MITKDYIMTTKKGAVVHLSYFVNGGHWQKIEIKQLPDGANNINASIIPVTIGALDQFIKQHKKNLTIEEIPPNLSFDFFYNEYGVKDKKSRAEKLWNKLSKDKKMKALNYIKRFRQKSQLDSIRMANPDTYLSQERWTDEE